MISSCLSSFAGAMCFCLKANINYSSGINAWIWTCCCLNSCLCFGCAVTNWLLDHASTWFLIMLIQIGDWWWVYSAHFTEPCTNCVFKKILVFINHGWFDHMPCSFPQSPQEGEQVAVPTYHPRSSRPPCEWVELVDEEAALQPPMQSKRTWTEIYDMDFMVTGLVVST